MKKFIFVCAMLFASMAGVNAQALHESKAFDNVYVSVNVGGTVHPLSSNAATCVENLRPLFGVEIGKDITSLYGMSIEGKTGINTTGVHTIFDDVAVTWRHKLNLTNAIGGYNPDRGMDVKFVGAAGWGHNTCITENYLVAEVGAEVVYNVSDAWDFNVRPTYVWNRAEDGLNRSNAEFEFMLGFSYKFKNHDGSRGFTVCNEDYLNELVNQLRAENEQQKQYLNGQRVLNEQLNDELAKWKNHQCEVDTVVIDNSVSPSIGFSLNSYKVNDQMRQYLYNIANLYKNDIIVVEGYADAKTGTADYNKELSLKRAEAVKDVLLKYGATNVTVKAFGSEVQPFTENDMNRVVIITK